MRRSGSDGCVRESEVLEQLLAVVPFLTSERDQITCIPLQKALITHKVGFVAQGAKTLLEWRALETAGTVVIELDPVHLSPLLDT